MISIRPSAVPWYLVESDLYKSLNKEDDQPFEVPEGNLKMNLEVQSCEDVELLFRTLHFWGFADMVRVHPSEVAPLLRKGTVYEFMSQMDDDNAFEIPKRFYRTTDEGVYERESFVHLFETLAVWGISEIPERLHEYRQMLDSYGFDKALLLEFQDRFPEMGVIYLYRTEQFHTNSLDCYDTVSQFAAHYCPNLFAYLANQYQTQLSSKHLAVAAEHGQLENFITTFELMRQPSFALVSTAKIAANGHLQCLKYVHQEGAKMRRDTCPSAARNGHLDCLMWAHKVGFPWSDTTRAACAGGHLHCLMYAYEAGCPIHKDSAAAAAEGDHLECLQTVFRLHKRRDANVCAAACKAKSLRCLQYAVEQGGQLDLAAVRAAADKEDWPCLLFLLISAPHLAGPAFSKLAIEQDSTEHLQTALDAQCPLAAGMCDTALQHNSQACLRLLHQRGLCDWTDSSCALAVEYDLPLLQLAHELGCPLTTAGVSLAIEYCFTESLAYLCAHGCTGDDTSAMAVLSSPNDDSHKSLRILHKHGHALTDPALCAAAAKHGLRKCLKYLHKAGCPWDIETCKGAADYGDTDCLAYAHEHGCPWDESVSALAIYEAEMLAYCVDQGCPISAKTMKKYNRFKAEGWIK